MAALSSQDLSAIGADFYTANAHKWLCAPKGAAFLHAKPQHHEHLRPPLVSHGYGSGFASEWAWQVTPTPRARYPPAIVRSHMGGGGDRGRGCGTTRRC